MSTALIDRMERQHQQIDDTLHTVGARLTRWAASATGGETLAAALDDHRRALLTHLDEEEDQVLPLIAEHLSAAERAEMGRLGARRTPRRKGFLVLGALLEEATPDEAAVFLAKLPPPVRWLWSVAGTRQYRGYLRRARSITPNAGPPPSP